MADELNKNAEFAGKHQDEENPVLVAQRYLNIYRQIHIFNKKRQNEFDDSLIKMPSDIRVLLSTLPGGSLLLEHISELEEKSGIIPNELLNSQITDNKNSNKEEKNVSSLRLNSKNADAALPGNLLKILQQNEEKHAKDLQALTNAFLQSQENMAALLKQALNIKTPADTSIQPSGQPPVSENVAPVKVQENPITVESKPEEEQRTEPEEAQKTEEEEAALPDTASKILNFTKKLFTPHKPEDEVSESSEDVPAQTAQKQATMPLVDHTPVSLNDIDTTPISLDDIDSTPVSLDDADTSFDFPVSTEQLSDQALADEQLTDNGEWEWEYVDGDENASSDNEEWEYIDDGTTDALQDEQWEYVEDPNAQYAYEYPSENNTDQWEYVEEPIPDTQNQS